MSNNTVDNCYHKKELFASYETITCVRQLVNKQL